MLMRKYILGNVTTWVYLTEPDSYDRLFGIDATCGEGVFSSSREFNKKCLRSEIKLFTLHMAL